MSKHNKPHWHEPVAAVTVDKDAPIESTIEVGVVALADGPLDPVPLSQGPPSPAEPNSSLSTSSYHKGTDVAQNTQDAVQGVADKAKDTAAQVQDKFKDAAADVVDKAKDAADKLAAQISDANNSAKDTADKAKSLPAKVSGATASGAQSAGTALWAIAQRSPLQALVFIGSLIWLIRHSQSAASEPTVSLNDAAGKVGTAAGQVQATLGTLGSQVKEQAQHGQGWLATTLHDSPLVIGAMALIAGAALGLSVPETSYEDKLLGSKRDELVGKVQDAAQDLTQKVTTVAQTAVHDAVESVKEEAKNQGLTGEAKTDGAKPAENQNGGQNQSQS